MFTRFCEAVGLSRRRCVLLWAYWIACMLRARVMCEWSGFQGFSSKQRKSGRAALRVVEAVREIRLNKRVSGRLFFLDLWLLCRWFCLFLKLCRLFEVFLFVRCSFLLTLHGVFFRCRAVFLRRLGFPLLWLWHFHPVFCGIFQLVVIWELYRSMGFFL